MFDGRVCRHAVEFMALKEVSTIFFLLRVISFVDAMGSFAIGIHPVQPEVIGSETEHAHTA